MNWEGIIVDIFKYSLIASGVIIVYYVSHGYAKKIPTQKLKLSIIAVTIIFGLSVFMSYPHYYKIGIETFIVLTTTSLLGIFLSAK